MVRKQHIRGEVGVALVTGVTMLVAATSRQQPVDEANVGLAAARAAEETDVDAEHGDNDHNEAE